VAVISVKDELREKEVMACIVAGDGVTANESLADEIFGFANEKLAYFKTPGWILFVESLPTTGTQKIQKTQIFPAGTDPRTQPGAFDFRDRKKKSK
jgi:crotonobetaine/carnitine-CoA ligase